MGRERWAAEVRARFGGHPFAAVDDGGRGLLDALIDGLCRRHLDDPRGATVMPPLPGLPRLPLDEWVELRVVPDRRLGRFRPAMIDGVPTEGGRATISVERVIQESDPVLIAGEPGSGKSTLLKWAAQRLILSPGLRGLVPLLVPLGGFARARDADPDRSVYHFLWVDVLRLPDRQAAAFEDFMLEAEGGSEERRALFHVFLDGWDEVPPGRRLDLLRWLERFEFTFPTTMTTRPSGLGGPAPNWVRQDLAPLTFEAMRQLVTKLARAAGKPWLVEDICAHLDLHTALRGFARNPFVLTLVYMVFSEAGGQALQTRAGLYAAAIELMRQSCNGSVAEHGVHFPVEAVATTQEAAFDLLRRPAPAPYEFRSYECPPPAPGDPGLFVRWERARMVTAASADAATSRFVHSTVHEALAGVGLGRRFARGQVALSDRGIRTEWLETLRFTFGTMDALPPDARSRLWAWLAGLCREADEFALIPTYAAHLIKESGVRDGVTDQLVRDILPRLWGAFLEAPDPAPYAAALVELDLSYVIAGLRAVERVTTDLVARIALVHFLTPAEDPRRGELVHLLARPLDDRGATGLTELPNLEESLGYAPDEASSLSSAADPRSAAELIAALTGEPVPARARLRLMNLARSRTAEAEEFLVNELGRETEPARVGDLADALQLLGTVGARDGLFANLDRFEAVPPVHARLLGALTGLFIDHGAEAILRYVEPGWDRDVRVRAATALGHCDRSRVLARLADHARLEEKDAAVRKAVIVAMTRARGFGLLRMLAVEPPGGRPDKEELELVWAYLGAIGRQIGATRDYGGQRATVEVLFTRELDRLEEPPPRLIAEAALEGSQAVATRLEWVYTAERFAPTTRAAALLALWRMGMPPPEESLLHGFLAAADGELRSAHATVLARTAPALLLGLRHAAARRALWEMSLETKRLVFRDRFGDEDEPFISEPPSAHGGAAQATAHVPRPRAAAPGATAAGSSLREAIAHLQGVFEWFRENADAASPDSPPPLTDEATLMRAWLESKDLSAARKEAYRMAAVFCAIEGMKFRIDKKEWGETSETKVFERGIGRLKTWTALYESLKTTGDKDVDSIRRDYDRACTEIDKASAAPLDALHSAAHLDEFPQSHKKRPGST